MWLLSTITQGGSVDNFKMGINIMMIILRRAISIGGQYYDFYSKKCAIAISASEIVFSYYLDFFFDLLLLVMAFETLLAPAAEIFISEHIA